MKNVETMFGVEHAYIDGRTTYDIFPSIKEAENFCNQSSFWNNEHIPLFIFQAEFNKEHVYIDEDLGCWTYDDFSDTIVSNYKILKEMNTDP
jgi:hypothetical protein